MLSRVLLAVLLAACLSSAWAGEYDLNIPEAEKTPWELGGRLELRYVQHWLNDQSDRYRLNYYNSDPGAYTEEWRPQLELQGGYRQGKALFHFLTHFEYDETSDGGEWLNRVYEAFATLKPSANLALEGGKKSFSWGKGYAWNPAGFINRPKDPDDPELNQEGYSFLGLDFIKSFTSSSLSNLAFTALALPVLDGWENTSLGQSGDLNYACKLYLLWHDTDLDFIYFGGAHQPDSFGFDFAKNLAENLEVHGEVGYRMDVSRTLLNSTGQTTVSSQNELSYLLGIRYLNAVETTFIVEYYHNGAGYDAGELDDFFAYQTWAYQEWLATDNDQYMQRANMVTRPYYAQRNFGEDYLYFKATQKEPLDILYFNPWLAVILNLQDQSFNLQPGMTYTAVTDLELNFRMGIPFGPAGTEFGEKQDAVRTEIWARYYF
ncbi:MAG: hypothetical protein KQJ78_11655 [Deltaproteobacteria bacterium]|nr:hypothetical protein [Deltaproteobacteria bacterium]